MNATEVVIHVVNSERMAMILMPFWMGIVRSREPLDLCSHGKCSFRSMLTPLSVLIHDIPAGTDTPVVCIGQFADYWSFYSRRPNGRQANCNEQILKINHVLLAWCLFESALTLSMYQPQDRQMP